MSTPISLILLIFTQFLSSLIKIRNNSSWLSYMVPVKISVSVGQSSWFNRLGPDLYIITPGWPSICGTLTFLTAVNNKPDNNTKAHNTANDNTSNSTCTKFLSPWWTIGWPFRLAFDGSIIVHKGHRVPVDSEVGDIGCLKGVIQSSSFLLVDGRYGSTDYGWPTLDIGDENVHILNFQNLNQSRDQNLRLCISQEIRIIMP